MKKKVLAVHPSSELYGADRIFVKVIKFLENDGYEVDVLLKCSGSLIDLLKSETNANILIKDYLPVAVRSSLSVSSLMNFILDNIKFLFFIFKNRNSYDVVYVNTLALFTVAMLSKICRLKKVISHSHEIIGKHGVLSRIIISITELFSDKIICVSDAVKEDMIKSSYFKNISTYTIVHNGIEDLRFSLNRTNDTINFLLLGRLMPEKGQWFLLETLAKLPKEELLKIKVQLVGSPPPFRKILLIELEEKIKNLNLKHVVEIIDFVKNPSELIAKSDVCLIPSLMDDPFPTTVIEAMCFGKAIITTNNGGSKEIIEHGLTGLLIHPNNINEFKEAILLLINNQHMIKEFGISARKKYENYLTLENFRNRFMKVFGEKN
jgi:glycosyltransferase involved in cell wall biosynthesis